ncbi:UNVERIFIED_CONTAM: hypothetical protein PYX00_011055 [Menopon gallinae]|uniref:ATP-dependent Clp protease proteolytic subunit n=1 Tax=Menopon gallinae TaxID=328185 RepID=A0AAW2H6Z9_9NEOP
MSEEKKSQEGSGLSLKELSLKTRSILLTGEVKQDSPAKIVSQLLLLESADAKAPIYLFIDSPGGLVDSGLAIYNAVRFVSCPVYTIGLGLVASIAATIFLAVPLSQRVALPYTRYLLHQPLGGVQGVVTDIEIHAKEMERTKIQLAQLISQATGKDLAEVIQHTDRDYWLSAQEAQDYGLVGQVIESREELNSLVANIKA